MPKLKFKAFQIDDYARMAMRDGGILAHDTGLGKSLAAFAIPLIKDNVRRVLLVAPESLHVQLRETARDMFDIYPLSLMSKEEFYEWGLDRPAAPLEPGEKPTFFITTYQALGHNDADEWTSDVDDDGNRTEKPTLIANRMAFLDAAGLQPADEDNYFYYTAGIGNEQPIASGHKVRCVWKPTLARLIQIHDSFDFVVVDEGVRLQSNDAHIATGVRTLNPRYRLVLSATPIKNRLDSLFWLAWWAAGGTELANPRWPYAGTSEAREAFASGHLLTDKFLTREKDKALNSGARGRPITRRSARITNLHRLWKIVAPVVLRRRKADCGEDIVPKTTHVVRVKPGTEQQRIYRHYLTHAPKRNNSLSSAGAQLTLLRQATVAPFTDFMKREGQWSPFVINPKISACLTLVETCLRRGEQVVIGSNFSEFGTALYGLLTQAGVTTCLLDGRMSPERRGRMAREFKDRSYGVMIAGAQAMGEGHNFDRCPNIIVPSLDWAFDVNSQLIDRVWRMTSNRPVNVYLLMTQGTVDEYLVEVFKEKDDSSQLALDGALQADGANDEASIEALLAKAIKGYKRSAESIPEATLENNWPVVAKSLASAQKHYSTQLTV